MSAEKLENAAQNDTVSVTLALDRKVFEFFSQKAQKAGVDVESYLGSTLSIVLGCKAFNNTYACSPQSFIESCEHQNSK